MKKRIYKATNVKQVNWSAVSDAVKDRSLVFSIDVAKEEQFAMLMDKEHRIYLTIKWDHLKQTSMVIKQLIALPCQSLEVAMEPTGVYGDTLRLQLKKAGFETTQIPAKRVNDAAEIYDGVPSLHDAKSAYIIGRLYWDKIGLPWRESSKQQREMKALSRLYAIYDRQLTDTRNRLEAQLQRHWPELQLFISLDKVTLEQLLIKYRSPEALAKKADEARAFMQKVSKGMLSQEKIDAIIETSSCSIGIPCIEAERWQIQQLGEVLQYFRLKKKEVAKKLEALVENDDQVSCMGAVVGKVTSAIFLSDRLDPRDYRHPKCYLKAFGLNLKEKKRVVVS